MRSLSPDYQGESVEASPRGWGLGKNVLNFQSEWLMSRYSSMIGLRDIFAEMFCQTRNDEGVMRASVAGSPAKTKWPRVQARDDEPPKKTQKLLRTLSRIRGPK